MGQALYRKYRSKSLSEVVGQEPITTALANALKNNQISHAYLFTGPRGIGKTTVARILAYEINGLEYTSDELPIDIIEIDAASNRRIDEIRDLREKVRIAPVSAKYKVYIIDEVHMLTKEAFNALLKTLEEPPAHVVFILATTEAHKLPETIVSRTQRYSFKSIPVDDIVGHLKSIAKKEKITIDDESLLLVANHSGGSLRDAISLLDQIRHSGSSITAAQVRQSFGLPSKQIIDKIIATFSTNDPAQVIELLKKANEEGASATLIASQLQSDIRQSIAIGKPVLPIEEAVELTKSLLLVETSQQPFIQLEVILIGAQLARNHHPNLEPKNVKLQKIEPPQTLSEPARDSLKNNKPDLKDSNQKEVWDEVLKHIKKDHDTLYGVIRMAKPEFDQPKPGNITLNFSFPFHYKRINESRHKQIITDAYKELGVAEPQIHCILLSKDQAKDKPTGQPETLAVDANQTSSNPVDDIKNIFGKNVEVLS